MEVREHLDVAFNGDYHGIYRDIPIEYPGPHGSNYELFLKVTGVTDALGHKLKYDSSVQNGYRHLKIYIPDAADSTKTVEIDYTVSNGVRWFDGYDELYWNVTGNDWPVPIDSAMAIIVFPPNAVGNLRAQAFTGGYGSQAQDATVVVNGNVVRFQANDPLEHARRPDRRRHDQQGRPERAQQADLRHLVHSQQHHCSAAAVGFHRDVLPSGGPRAAIPRPTHR